MRTGAPQVGVPLNVLLVTMVWAHDRGHLGDATAGGLALAAIAAGAAWAAWGPERLRRLSELWLWLAFVLSIALIRAVTDAWAARSGQNAHTLFLALSTAHLAVAAGALHVLGAWSRDAVAFAAGLLVAGAVLFWNGARTFAGMSLEAVSSSPEGFRWTALAFIGATLVTLVALGLLTRELRRAGADRPAAAGLLLVTLGAVPWIVHLVLRITVMIDAADAWSANGMAPEGYSSWRHAISLLFAAFNVLTWAGVVAFGVAFLRTGLLPRWIGWLCIGAGILLAPTFRLPLFIHVVWWIVGMVALTRPLPTTHGDSSRSPASAFNAGSVSDTPPG